MRELKITQTFTHRTESLEAYHKMINKFPLVSPEEEVELAQRIRKGDERAFDKLVKANLRFVESVARQYGAYGMDLMDLIEEGNIGLMIAARRFDETKGFKFVSYAVWWIRQHILLALSQQGNMVHMPLNHVQEIGKVNRAIAQFEQMNERMPSVAELAEMTDIREDRVAAAMNAARHSSIDEPMTPGEDGTFLDIMSDSGSLDNVEKGLMHESLEREMDAALNVLEPREQKVVRMFFGLGNTCQHSLDEIGAMLNISRERVRQIKDRSVKILRYSPNAHLLCAFL